MAKKARNKPDSAASKPGRPYLAAALFCESVIEDKSDGSISAIRVIDKVTVTIPAEAPPTFPNKDNRVAVTIKSLVGFRTGRAPGKHTLGITMISPSGKKSRMDEKVLDFKAPEHSAIALGITHNIAVMRGGLFWFDVFLDGKRITRIPLEIEIQRAAPAQSDASQKKSPTQPGR
jgi:hypothetical protein